MIFTLSIYITVACVAGRRMGWKGPKGTWKVPHTFCALPCHALRALAFSLFPPLRRLPRRLILPVRQIIFTSWLVVMIFWSNDVYFLDDIILHFLFLYYTKQIHVDSMLPCVCLKMDHRKHQNVERTLVTHSLNGTCASLVVLTTFWHHLQSAA